MANSLIYSSTKTNLEMINTAAVKQEQNAERNSMRSLRNFKLRVPPLNTLKTEAIELNIKKDPDCVYAIGNTDRTVEGRPRCSTSEINHVMKVVPIKRENVELEDNIEENNSNIIIDLPLKCIVEEPFACTHCNYTSLSEEKFKYHVSIHYMEKPFSCELCHYITKHRGALKNHMLTHTKLKRFTCEICSFKTNYKGSLKSHMQIHTGDKQFNCNFCTFKTNYKNHHDQHMLSHTGMRSFFCDFCPFKTRKKGDFRAHILGHTQPFKCQLCLYETSSKNLLSIHMLNCCVLIRPRKRLSVG